MVRIKNRVVIKAALLALLVFAASGCNDNLLRPKAEKAKAEVTKTESKLYRVEGYFEQKGAVPAAFNSTAEGQNARTAMPDMTGIEYSIKAENGTTTYSSDNSGNIEIDGTFFKLALPQGTWTITVEGRTAAAGSTDAACVTGNAKVTLSAENPVAQVNIAVKPSMNGTGSVNLTVGVAPDSGINGVKWTLPDPANRSEFINFTSNSATINLQDIKSGSYTLVMEFYSSSEDDEGQLLYMVRESVNVFDGATTDTWSGNSPYLRDGTFTVTKELVETFAQTTFYVSLGGDDSNSGSLPSLPFATIQNAVDKAVAMNAALPSDEGTPYRILLLSNVTCDGTASFAGNNNAFVNITPTEPLHLVIEPYKKDVATIDANGKGRVMYIGENANVTMNSLTITGGHITTNGGSGGGGIYSKGNCIFSSCIVSGNTATSGGGLNFSPASNDDDGNKLKLTNCTIEDNTAEGGGGGGILFCPEDKFSRGTTLELIDCTIRGNTATRDNGSVYGGGIYCYGKAPKVILDGGSIKNNTVGSENNMVYAYGGGIYSDGGTVTISGATISENKAISSSNQAYGGGLSLSAGTTAEISGNSEISNNSANFGGGILISSSTVTITYASVSSNRSTDNGSGGGIYIWGGSLTTTGMTLDSNTASLTGGGIYIANDTDLCKITGGTISGNEAMAGGGIHISASANVTIVDASISGNSSTNTSGGGIYISSGSLTTTDMTLDNNTAKTVGGGIRIEGGTVTITGGTISGNVATNGAGGGVSNDSNCTLDSVELRDNQAKATDGNGGAISNLGGATLTLNGGTIEGNTAAGNGGAIYNNGTLKVQGALSIPCGETGEHDVYLFNSENNIMTPITITGDLATEGTVATITPGNYTPDVQVLQASNVTLANQVGKFNVTPQTDGTGWTIDGEGRLSGCFKYVEGATINGITGSGYTYSEIFKSGEEVTVPSFYISDHEVTQAEYRDIMGNWPDASMSTEQKYGEGDNYPAYYVSWFDTLVYCNKRSIQENLTPCYSIVGSTNPDDWGDIPDSENHENWNTWLAVDCDVQADGYRLPTEAEWEYAARGGNGLTGYQYQYAGSNNIDDVAWYSSNSNSEVHEVKSKRSNGLGLYDMSGNLAEWCWNYVEAKGTRCSYGGDWGDLDTGSTVNSNDPSYVYARQEKLGFRVCRTITE